jgi:hypothetical protein
MTTSDYLVEMKLAPVANVPTPQEGVAFTERFVLPTLEAFERLVAEGHILAGGPLLAGMGFSFVIRAASPAQLEALVATLPLWPRAQTTVVPLASFGDRAATVRERLATLKARIAETASTGNRNN